MFLKHFNGDRTVGVFCQSWTISKQCWEDGSHCLLIIIKSEILSVFIINNMDYKIFKITGVMTSYGKVLPTDFHTILRSFDDFFEDRTVTTNVIYDSDRFTMRADTYSMEQIQELVSSGIVMVPFSRRWYVHDLLSYCDLGLEIRFMLIKDYKELEEEYSDSQLVGVEDHRTKALF